VNDKNMTLYSIVIQSDEDLTDNLKLKLRCWQIISST